MEENETKQKKHTISERWVFAFFAVLLVLTCAAGILFYAEKNMQKNNPVLSTPAPEKTPSVTPIQDEQGNPLTLDVWFPKLNGECMIAKSADGKTLILDSGSSSDSAQLLSFIDSLGIGSFDYALLTAPEDRYTGCWKDILSRCTIKEFFLTKNAAKSKEGRSVVSLFNDYNVSVSYAAADFVSVLPWAENTELRILSPYDAAYSRDADYSLMLRIEYGHSRLLLAGPSTELAQRLTVKALPNRLIHTDILKFDISADPSVSKKFISATRADLIFTGFSAEKAESDFFATLLKKKYEKRFSSAEELSDADYIHIVLDGAKAKVVKY